MKCVIPGTNIKVFGRAVHSLSKIGDELYIEPLDHGLALRTVNSSRSAYACFLFAPSFFQHYDDGSSQLSPSDSEDSLRCKIAMKSILTVFKSLSSMEKTVERCKIHLNMDDSRLVFMLYCRHGIVKTYNLAFIECETLQAVFSKDMSPNSLTASARLLCDAVLNFQNNQEEITLIVNPERILLKNYVEDEPDPTKVMHTELCLDPNEFDNCQLGVDTDVTFCLKELRAILAFSEVTNLPLTFRFETAGRPIVCTIDSDSTFEANFVLATLAEQQTQSSQMPPQTKASQKRKTSSTGTSSRPTPAPRRETSTTGRPGQNRNNSSRHPGDVPHTDRNSSELDRSQRLERLEAAYEELMNDNDFDEMLVDCDVTVSPGRTVREAYSAKPVHGSRATSNRAQTGSGVSSAVNRPKSPMPSTSREGLDSPVIPVQDTDSRTAVRTTLADVSKQQEDEDEEEEEAVPGTPPAKRFRALFFGSSQASTQRSQAEQHSTSAVLVVDTDDED